MAVFGPTQVTTLTVTSSMTAPSATITSLDAQSATTSVRGLTILYNAVGTQTDGAITPSAVNTAIDSLESSLTSEISSVNTSLSSDISELSTRITTLENTFNGNLTALEDELSSSINSLTSRVTSLETSVTDINSTISTIQSDISSISSSVTTLQTDLTELQSEFNVVQSTVNTISPIVTTLQSNVSTIQSTLTSISNEFELMEQSLDIMESTVEGVQTTVNSLQLNSWKFAYTTTEEGQATILLPYYVEGMQVNAYINGFALYDGSTDTSGTNTMTPMDAEFTVNNDGESIRVTTVNSLAAGQDFMVIAYWVAAGNEGSNSSI